MSDEEETRDYGAESYSRAPEAVRAESVPDSPAPYMPPPATYAPYPGAYNTPTPGSARQAYPPTYRQVGFKKTNGMAVAGFVLGLSQLFLLFTGIAAILAIVFSHIGLAQARRRNENGVGLAITGLILGYLGIATILLVVLYFVAHANGVSGDSSSFDT